MSVGELESDCRAAVQDVRGALIELYASMGIEPGTPQRVARQFQLNKNLTWKISKIIASDDPLAAIAHLPGAGGVEILLNALTAAGAPIRLVEGVRGAMRTFDAAVERHAGGRADLDLMLDSMGLAGDSNLVASRELAFRGNSGVWGVQAKLRTVTGIVVPSRETATGLDVATVGGFVGFRMLRPSVSWRLFRFHGYKDDGSESDFQEGELDDASLMGHRLLREFCSEGLPPIRQVQNGRYREYYLDPEAVGNTGTFDCYFGSMARGLPRYATPEDSRGEFSSMVTLPVETAVMDVLVHRDIKVDGVPEVLVYGMPDGDPDMVSNRVPSLLLPLNERCVELAGRPPALSIAAAPRYSELVHSVYEQLGHVPSDFRGYRLTVRHPPMNSCLIVRWNLESRPG